MLICYRYFNSRILKIKFPIAWVEQFHKSLYINNFVYNIQFIYFQYKIFRSRTSIKWSFCKQGVALTLSILCREIQFNDGYFSRKPFSPVLKDFAPSDCPSSSPFVKSNHLVCRVTAHMGNQIPIHMIILIIKCI